MDDQRTANVQLTADVQQYSQGIQQANKDTTALLASVNKLSASLDGITKRVGKRMMLFAAADIAVMSTAVAVTARYEAQLRTLRADVVAGGKSMAAFTDGIKAVTKQIPVSRGEITELTTQIAQLGITTSSEIPKMAMVFERMSAATGESVGQLTSGLIELSRTMGTLPNGAAGLEAFSDSVVKLSSELGVSSTAVLSFAQNIAPIADVAGVTQAAVLGLSAAFVRAGADGVAGANAFNTIMRDVVQMSTTGSPELIKYANAANMSLDAFKNLEPAKQFVAIMNSVSGAGTKGIQMLDAIGVDGIRTVKAVAAVTREYGSLEKAMGISEGAYGQGWTKRASEAAWDDMQAAAQRTQNTLQDMADMFGSTLYPAAKTLLNVFNEMLSVAARLSEPFLKLAGVISGVTAAFTGVVGGMLSAMGPLSTLMLAMTAFRLSPLRAGGAGFTEGINTARTPVPFAPVGPTTEAGRRAAAGNLPFYQRVPYMVGERIGSAVGRYFPEGAANAFRSAGYGAFRVTQMFADGQRQLIANAAMRQGLDRVSTFSSFGQGQQGGPVGPTPGLGRAMSGGMFSMFRADPRAFMSGLFSGQPDAMQGRSLADMTKNMQATTAAYASHAAAVAAARGSTASLAAAAGGAARSLALIPLAYSRMALSLGAQAAGGILAAPFRMIGGMVGMGGGAGAAIAALAGTGYMVKQALDSNRGSWSGESNLTEYNTALGIATEPLSEFTVATKNAIASLGSMTDAFQLAADNAGGTGGDYTDKRAGYVPTNARDLAAYMQSMGTMNPQQAYRVAEDVARNAYGTINPQEVFDLYNQQTNFGQNPFGQNGQALKDLLASAGRTQTRAQGWMQDIWNVTTDETRGLLEQAYATAVMETDQYRGRTVGQAELELAGASNRDIANIASATGNPNGVGLERIVQATRTRQSIEQGVSTLSYGQLNDLLNTIAKQIGGEQGTFGIGQQEIRGLAEGGYGAIAARIAASETDAAKKFTSMMNYGVSDTTLESLLAMSPAGAEPRTALGRFAAGSQTFQAASATGDASANPKEIFNAIRETAKFLIDTSKSAADIATTVRAEMAMYAPTERGYGLYQAAGQLAQRESLYATEVAQGQRSATGSRYEMLVADIRSADDGADVTAQRDELFQIQGSTRQDAANYLLFVKNFYRQLQYTVEDRQRSLARAAEDAAKGMFSPYERMAAQATSSVETMLGNTAEQVQYAKAGRRAVDQMKGMGLSQQSVDLFNLADPQMAQQALRTLMDLQSNPELIARMNKNARSMGKTAKDVTQNEDNVAFRRSEEDFNIARTRNMDSLKRYGEEILGETNDVLKETQGYLQRMGVRSTNYFQSLSDLASRILAAGSNPQQGDVPPPSSEGVYPAGETGPMSFPANPKTGDRYTYGDQTWKYTASNNRGEGAWNPYDWSAENRPEFDPNDPNAFLGVSRLGGPYNIMKGKDGKLQTYTTKNILIDKLPAGFDVWRTMDQDQWWQENVVAKGKGAFLGGIVKGGQTINVGEHSRDEMIVPLFGTGYNGHVSRLASAISQEMLRSTLTASYGSRPSSPAYAGGSVTYNNGTYINGPITVQAQDPNEMARKMREKARLTNLSKGANASV